MAKSFNERMQERFALITSSVDKANNLIHETAVEICEHTLKHGDCTLAQGLVMAMPASMRREMLILWFSMFTPIVVKNDSKWAAKMHKPDSKLYVEWNLDGGKAKPFFELAKENKERPPLTLAAILETPHAAAKRILTAMEEGRVEPHMMDVAANIVSQLNKIKVQLTVASATPEQDKEPGALPVEQAA